MIATVSSHPKERLARAAGAEVVLNYRDPTFAADLRAAAPDGVQHVVDVAPSTNVASYLPVLDQQASIASYAVEPPGTFALAHMPAMERNLLVRFVLLYTLPGHTLFAGATAVNVALWAGDLTALPDQRLPLERIADAHDAVEAGAVGRVLVELP